MSKRFKNIGISTLVATLFLLVATKSSPLYPLNDWVDANAIFTVGKSMMNGKILYKDIFEQKGPALFFVHGLGSLLSKNTFFGIFIMEILAFSCFLFFARKIMAMYLSNQYLFIATLCIAFFMTFIINFSHGDSAEEYCIPLLGISMYHLVKHLKLNHPKAMPLKILLINGFLAGCVVWIKYSMIGYWFGWMLVVLFTIILAKRYIDFFRASFVFLGGMVLSGVPWLVYFYVNDGLGDFIDVYFLTNIKYYASSESLITNLITMSGKIILVYFLENIAFALVFMVGLAVLLFTNVIEKNRLVKLGFLGPFVFLFLSVYSGGIRHDYYFQIFTPLIIFGVMFLLLKLQKMMASKTINFNIINTAVVSFLMLIMFFFHHNIYFMKKEKEDLFQYQFAEYISEFENPTLLNYGFLDVGLYNTADIEPSTWYFMKHNFDYSVYPFDVDALNSYVENGLVDFIILRANSGVDYKNDVLDIKYRKVMQQEQFYEGEFHNYILYQKK